MSPVPADPPHPGDPGHDSDRDAQRDAQRDGQRDGQRDAQLDAQFAAIVAGWDQDSADPVPRWPANEDRAEAAEEQPQPPPATSMEQIRYVRDHGLPTPAPPRPEDEPDEPAAAATSGAPTGPRDWELAARPDEHFVPPEPPPLPRGDLVSRLAWGGVLLGPLLLLLFALFWQDATRLWIAAACAAFVGGFATLVLRLPDRREHDDDDGAVV